MIDISTVEHFKPLEDLTKILMVKANNFNPGFFRISTAYFFAKVAATMRVSVKTHDRGTIPVNMYAINLSVSGSGKGTTTNIIEEQVIEKFKDYFMKYTFPTVKDRNLQKLADKLLFKDPSLDPTQCRELIDKDFDSQGKWVFSFSSATTPAVKQMRQMLLMAGIGSVNLEIDEIGSNLLQNQDVLTTFLELFDVGKTKPKLTKNTPDNKRLEDLDGQTFTNMLWYGTSTELLCPGTKLEEAFINFLKIGFARRCFFGYTTVVNEKDALTVDEIYALRTDPAFTDFIDDLADTFKQLANEINFDTVLEMSEEVAKGFIEYEQNCRLLAKELPSYKDIEKTELQHRHWKTLKLAGVYAFIDGSPQISETHMLQAIKLAEESGDSLKRLLQREKAYVTLANYIAEQDKEVNITDIIEDLPFFKGNKSHMENLMTLATAYGYSNNIVIKKSYKDDIEFFKGETLKPTNLDEVSISLSNDITTGYQVAKGPFSKLGTFITTPGYHYTAHAFRDGYRSSDNMIPGFNLVILDVDNGTTIDTAKELLKDYTALFATTKRHQPDHHRFRIILPLSHEVKLNRDLYSRFMENIFNWLPFVVDSQTKDCARKWLTSDGDYSTQDGRLLNAFDFIPNTRQEERQSKKINEYSDLSNLERWFLLNSTSGNRNNQLLKYALVLVDNGQSVNDVRTNLQSFNGKLKQPLSLDEIDATVMQTVIKHVNQKN